MWKYLLYFEGFQNLFNVFVAILLDSANAFVFYVGIKVVLLLTTYFEIYQKIFLKFAIFFFS
jgi:hypothetical protein